ncbi:MAG: tRNA (adenine-N1)-methyltransferase [Syntrophobacteraceae bacterium]
MPPFSPGDWIMLVGQKGKKWLTRVAKENFSCHFGAIRLGDAIGREEGDFLETNKGAKLFLLRPTLEDYIFKMKRLTQIIYPKDLGAMLFHGDICPGCTVLESGVGSGALSLALLRAIGESGKLISVEKRWDFAQLAKQNIAEYYGYEPVHHEVVVADIQDFRMTKEVDRAMLDLPEPWHAIGNVSTMLRRGGILTTLSPNVGQVQLTYREMKLHGFTNICTFELLKRDWMIDQLRARPTDRMVAHTGFIMTAKKGGALMSGQIPEENAPDAMEEAPL